MFLRAVLDGRGDTARPVALLLLDIDHFKEIKRQASVTTSGDHVLREVARRLAGIDDEVLVVRLGGDEFAAVVPGPVARADEFAEAIDRVHATNNLGARRFSRGPGVDWSGAQRMPRLPVFCCVTPTLPCIAPSERAPAPRGTRPEDNPHTERRIMLMQGLVDAIESGHIRPWFQPQIDILTGEVVGGEALARWDHPRLGVVGAAELLEHVRLAGKQHEFSVAMLRRSIEAAISWPGHIRLSVNVSLRDIRSRDFGAEVEFLPRNDGV